MAYIRYTINSGIGPFIATITPPVVPANEHASIGTYYFNGLPYGEYKVEVHDYLGCGADFNVDLCIEE